MKIAFFFIMLASFSLPVLAANEITTLDEFATFCRDIRFDYAVYKPTINRLCQHVTANDVFSYAITTIKDDRIVLCIIQHANFKPLRHDAEGMMPIHRAILANRRHIVETLLKRSHATVNAKTSPGGLTPLHVTILMANEDDACAMIDILLAYGADASIRSN